MKVSHDSEKPAHGQQVITACAFLYHNFDGLVKVFLPKRADTKKFLPGVYELPGGHIEYGEDIVLGLQREILEEFEMHITVGEPFYVFTYLNKVKGTHSIEVVYFAQFVDPLERIVIHPEDHSSYGWFGQEDIMKQVVLDGGHTDDDEIKAMYQGFSLLASRV